SIHEGASFGEMVNDLFDLGKVMKSGGVIGGLIAYGMFRALSMAGTLPLLILGFLYCFIVCCWGSMRGLIARITRSHNAYVQYEQQRAEQKKNEPVKPLNSNRKPPKIIQSDRRVGYNVDIPLGEEEDLFDTDKAAKALKTGIRRTSGSGRRQPQIIHEAYVDDNLTPPPTVNGKISEARAEAAQIASVHPQADPAAAGTGIPAQQPENVAAVPVKRGPGRPKGSVKTVREEVPTPDEVRKEREKIEQAVAGTAEMDDYVFPPLSLLRASSGMTADATDEVSLNRVRLE
ncbi:MAG: hypothetical protein IKE04_01465, partial [Oscillospiraceae bacterium]|nr:hypothetical protein [Oscillospiraceae bacterium]